MTTELTQITNLIKSKSEKVENICHKEVHKIKLEKRNLITSSFLILKVF